MKTFYVTVPREKRIYFTVEAEDSREARFEAIRHLVFDVMQEMIPLDIIEGDTVYQCVGCAQFFTSTDLREIDGRLYCESCKSFLIHGIPDQWK